MLCFHRLFSQCMSSFYCCPVYSSCVSSGTVLNRELTHLKAAFISDPHQRKWFFIKTLLLAPQIYFSLIMFHQLLEISCSICWLCIHNIVKTKPVIVYLQTSQRHPELSYSKIIFHRNPDPSFPQSPIYTVTKIIIREQVFYTALVKL